ncbi:MAG: amidohydrolase [Bacteroidetes bacterium]|nr:amidohydrolase [Bacteroidota bacterium]
MKKILYSLLGLGIIFGIYYAIVDKTQPADLLILNATIYTVDESNSVQQAMAIRGSRIIAVGTTEDIQKRYSSQNVIDANGKTIIPGMIDSHAHVFEIGTNSAELNLVGTTSSEESAALVAERVKRAAPGEWIRGHGWDQNDWDNTGRNVPFPTAAILDNVAPNNPVVLERIDGHALWVNSQAMKFADILNDKKERKIEGGKIYRDQAGNPTGIFIDNAERIIYSVVPDYSDAEMKAMYQRAFDECLKFGLTSVHDMGISERAYNILNSFAQNNLLPVRIYAAVLGDNSLWSKAKAQGPLSGKFLSLRAIKMLADGALGSRGAALMEPYSDEPGNRGLEITSKEKMKELAEDAVQHGFQVCVHAIGDRGNKNILDIYEELEQKYPAKAELARFRVEHAQVLSNDDLLRFKKLHVLPSMQPIHCTSDMYWAQARLGPERIQGAYAWRRLLDDGNIIASGSDAPVENPNPLLGFYAAITRQDKDGIPQSAADVAAHFQLSADGIKDSSNFLNGWYPQEKMTREEALKSYTIWGAYAEFAEKEKGSLEPGKLADFVVLSKDIMKVEPKQILSTLVDMTVVDGKIAYQRTITGAK